MFSISWRFDSISNIGIENRVESNRIDSKIVGIESSFDSISKVRIENQIDGQSNIFV